MAKCSTCLHCDVNTILLLALCTLVGGCFTTQHIKAIRQDPYPVLSQDESATRFGDPEDNVFIEVRRAKTSRPVQDLAIQYGALFPGGEVIRPGDREEYVKIDGRKRVQGGIQDKIHPQAQAYRHRRQGS